MRIKRSSLIPYSIQIADSIKEEIIRKRLPKDYCLPSVKQLAKEFSVSIETVRTALRELTNQGVVSVQHGKGTFVMKDYLTLMKEEEVPEIVRENIGVIMRPFPKEKEDFHIQQWERYIRSWWGGYIFAGIQCQAGAIGRFLTVIPRNTSKVEEFISLIEYSKNQVSGFIIFPFMGSQDDRRYLLDFLYTLKIPWVTLNKIVLEQEHNFITVNYNESGRLAAEYLVEKGHRSFLLIGDHKDTAVPVIERFNGFISTLEEKGLNKEDFEIRYIDEPHNEWYSTDTFQYGSDVTKRFLDECGKPDAIFASADHLAIGAIKAVMKEELRVPEDISVMGSTGLEIGEHIDPSLSTVASPIYLQGIKSVDYIIDSIKTQNLKKEGIVLQPRLLIRDSTR